MWWDSIAEVLLWTSTHTKEWMLGHYVFQATVMPLGFIEAVLRWNPGFPGDSVGKEPACRAGDAGPWVWSLGQEDSLEESMATYSSILAWRIIPMDRGASWATVQEVTKSPTWLNWTELNLPFVYIYHEMSIQISYPFFNWVICWVAWVPHVLWIQVSYRDMICQYFLLFGGLSFHFLDGVLWSMKF